MDALFPAFLALWIGGPVAVARAWIAGRFRARRRNARGECAMCRTAWTSGAADERFLIQVRFVCSDCASRARRHIGVAARYACGVRPAGHRTQPAGRSLRDRHHSRNHGDRRCGGCVRADEAFQPAGADADRGRRTAPTGGTVTEGRRPGPQRSGPSARPRRPGGDLTVEVTGRFGRERGGGQTRDFRKIRYFFVTLPPQRSISARTFTFSSSM